MCKLRDEIREIVAGQSCQGLKNESLAPVLWGGSMYNVACRNDVILLHQCVLVAGPGVELLLSGTGFN